MFKTVLFPVDRSRETREAIDIVSNIVRTYQSRLTLLSVVEEQADNAMNSEAEVAKLLQGVKTLFSEQGINAETLEREGIPSFTICDVADEINADLIIMGSRGMGLTQDNPNESVAHRAIDLAPCPILIVP
jgi:nucleotide-binding universal stress UspA family protein